MNMLEVISIMNFFCQCVGTICLYGNVFDGDGCVLLLTFLNIVLMWVEVFEALSSGHPQQFNTGVVVIVEQGGLLRVFHFNISGTEANGQGVLHTFMCCYDLVF